MGQAKRAAFPLPALYRRGIDALAEARRSEALNWRGRFVGAGCGTGLAGTGPAWPVFGAVPKGIVHHEGPLLVGLVAGPVLHGQTWRCGDPLASGTSRSVAGRLVPDHPALGDNLVIEGFAIESELDRVLFDATAQILDQCRLSPPAAFQASGSFSAGARSRLSVQSSRGCPSRTHEERRRRPGRRACRSRPRERRRGSRSGTCTSEIRTPGCTA